MKTDRKRLFSTSSNESAKVPKKPRKKPKVSVATKKTKPTKAVKKSNTRKPKTELQGKQSPSTSSEESSDEVIFPHIASANWSKFESNINQTEDEITKTLNRCLARMHGMHEVSETHFTSLHYVRVAILDCLTNRKWDNLIKLVIMLGRNYMDPVFITFIRQVSTFRQRTKGV